MASLTPLFGIVRDVYSGNERTFEYRNGRASLLLVATIKNEKDSHAVICRRFQLPATDSTAGNDR